MQNQQILITFPTTPEEMDALRAAAPGAEFFFIPQKQVSREDVLRADIILGAPPLKFLRENDHLALLALSRAGSADVCEPGVLSEHTVLTNATGAYGIIISEWMIGMLLNIYNHFALYRAQQMQGLWQKQSLPRHSIYGARVLIVGAGNIGSEFAKRAKAMGAVTVGVRRSAAPGGVEFDEMHTNADLDALLPTADIVALSVPGTQETAHLLGRERLFCMKEGAVLLNVGRGSAVDTDALYDALRENHLLAAALDVTDPEPLPAEHPLWTLDNAYITPHISGGLDSPISRRIAFEICLENLRAYYGDGEYRNLVDRKTGYRRLNG